MRKDAERKSTLTFNPQDKFYIMVHNIYILFLNLMESIWFCMKGFELNLTLLVVIRRQELYLNFLLFLARKFISERYNHF